MCPPPPKGTKGACPEPRDGLAAGHLQVRSAGDQDAEVGARGVAVLSAKRARNQKLPHGKNGYLEWTLFPRPPLDFAGPSFGGKLMSKDGRLVT